MKNLLSAENAALAFVGILAYFMLGDLVSTATENMQTTEVAAAVFVLFLVLLVGMNSNEGGKP